MHIAIPGPIVTERGLSATSCVVSLWSLGPPCEIGLLASNLLVVTDLLGVVTVRYSCETIRVAVLNYYTLFI